MRAVLVTRPGGPDALEVVDQPAPVAGPAEVLVEVSAAGVNRADLLQRRGLYDPPAGASKIPGLEVSGVVRALGDGVSDYSLGDEVVCLLSGGGYAEQVAVPVAQVAPVPPGVDLIASGGLIEAAATVWSNVFMTARLRPRERLLVHGGASGIGTMAIQIATALGSEVVVTVGSADKAAFCLDLGATLAINYREQDFAQIVKSQQLWPDVILDIIGAKYLEHNVAAVATDGRIVIIGMQGGSRAELDIAKLLTKRAGLTATTLRARPPEQKAAVVADVVREVWPLVAAQRVRPIIHETFGLDQASQAHQVLEDSSHIGKVLLIP